MLRGGGNVMYGPRVFGRSVCLECEDPSRLNARHLPCLRAMDGASTEGQSWGLAGWDGESDRGVVQRHGRPCLA